MASVGCRGGRCTQAARGGGTRRANRRHAARADQGSRRRVVGGRPVREDDGACRGRRLGVGVRQCRGRRHRGHRAASRDPRHHRARALDHQPQRFPGCRLQPVGQSVSRLRARLRLLLRAAVARIPRPLPGAGFRDAPVRQDQCRRAPAPRAVQARLHPRDDRAGHQHRCLPADRAPPSRDARGARSAGRMPASGELRDQERADHARRRAAGGDGAPAAGDGLLLDHHAGQPPGREDGAARHRAARQAARDAHPGRCRRAGGRDGGAGGADAHRQRARTHPRGGARARCGCRQLRAAAAAARTQAGLARVAAAALSRSRRARDAPGPADAWWQGLRQRIRNAHAR